MMLAVQTQRASVAALLLAPLVAWSLWRAMSRQGDLAHSKSQVRESIDYKTSMIANEGTPRGLLFY